MHEHALDGHLIRLVAFDQQGDLLMDVAQAQSGLMQLNIAETDLRALLAEVVELYDHVAQEKEIEITISADEPIAAPVDSVRMRQAFANLLDNALKYTPRGGRVSIELRPQQEQVEIVFTDNGAGISEKDLPRIWERLYRGDKSRNTPGLGLGLSLVKAIVETHGGRIEISSSEGKGSKFRVYLPATSGASITQA